MVKQIKDDWSWQIYWFPLNVNTSEAVFAQKTMAPTILAEAWIDWLQSIPTTSSISLRTRSGSAPVKEAQCQTSCKAAS